MREFRVNRSITNRNDNSLKIFLNEIGRIKLLNIQEEIVLVQKIRAGDHKALQALTVANLRFVVTIAKRYKNEMLSIGDLVNEGCMGLMKAAMSFDETKGFKFISYAVWWIRQYMLTAQAQQVRMIRIPVNQQLSINKINKIALKMAQILGREPSLSELSEETGKTEKQLDEALRTNEHIVLLEDPIPGGDSDCSTLMNFISNVSDDLINIRINQEAKESMALRLLSKLTDRERQILIFAYGLLNAPKLKDEDIAIKFNITGERVRQLRSQGIKYLSKFKQEIN